MRVRSLEDFILAVCDDIANRYRLLHNAWNGISVLGSFGERCKKEAKDKLYNVSLRTSDDGAQGDCHKPFIYSFWGL